MGSKSVVRAVSQNAEGCCAAAAATATATATDSNSNNDNSSINELTMWREQEHVFLFNHSYNGRIQVTLIAPAAIRVVSGVVIRASHNTDK